MTLLDVGDGRVLLSTISESSVQTTKVIHRHRGRSHRLKFSLTDPHVFFSCGEDGYCYLHDLRESFSQLSQETPTAIPSTTNSIQYQNEYRLRSSIYSVDINPQLPYHIAIGGDTFSAKIFDVRSLSTSESLCAPVASYYTNDLENSFDEYRGICGLQYHGHGKEIIISYNNENIYRYDLQLHNKLECPIHDHNHIEYLTRYDGHMNRETIKQVTYFSVHNSEFGLSGKDYVLSGSDSGHIFIWDRDSGSIVKILIGSHHAINCVTPHSYLPLIASSGIDRTVKLWYPDGDVAWLGKPFSVDPHDSINGEETRIEAELFRLKGELEVENEYMKMLLSRTRGDSFESIILSNSSGELSPSTIPASDVDDFNVSGEYQHNPSESSIVRRRTFTEMELDHQETNSGDETGPPLRLRRYVREIYERLSEFDRLACRREGIEEDSESDIYYDESVDESSDEDLESSIEEESVISSEPESDEYADPEEISAEIEERENSEGSLQRINEYEDID